MTESSNLRTALRIATVTAAGLTAVQVAVWLLICLIGTRWVTPWWVWTALPAAALFGVDRLAHRPGGAGRAPAGADGGKAW
jgi:hypothetical protein